MELLILKATFPKEQLLTYPQGCGNCYQLALIRLWCSYLIEVEAIWDGLGENNTVGILTRSAESSMVFQ